MEYTAEIYYAMHEQVDFTIVSWWWSTILWCLAVHVAYQCQPFPCSVVVVLCCLLRLRPCELGGHARRHWRTLLRSVNLNLNPWFGSVGFLLLFLVVGVAGHSFCDCEWWWSEWVSAIPTRRPTDCVTVTAGRPLLFFICLCIAYDWYTTPAQSLFLLLPPAVWKTKTKRCPYSGSAITAVSKQILSPERRVISGQFIHPGLPWNLNAQINGARRTPHVM